MEALIDDPPMQSDWTSRADNSMSPSYRRPRRRKERPKSEAVLASPRKDLPRVELASPQARKVRPTTETVPSQPRRERPKSQVVPASPRKDIPRYEAASPQPRKERPSCEAGQAESRKGRPNSDAYSAQFKKDVRKSGDILPLPKKERPKSEVPVVVFRRREKNESQVDTLPAKGRQTTRRDSDPALHGVCASTFAPTTIISPSPGMKGGRRGRKEEHQEGFSASRAGQETEDESSIHGTESLHPHASDKRTKRTPKSSPQKPQDFSALPFEKQTQEHKVSPLSSHTKKEKIEAESSESPQTKGHSFDDSSTSQRVQRSRGNSSSPPSPQSNGNGPIDTRLQMKIQAVTALDYDGVESRDTRHTQEVEKEKTMKIKGENVEEMDITKEDAEICIKGEPPSEMQHVKSSAKIIQQQQQQEQQQHMWRNRTEVHSASQRHFYAVEEKEKSSDGSPNLKLPENLHGSSNLKLQGNLQSQEKRRSVSPRPSPQQSSDKAKMDAWKTEESRAESSPHKQRDAGVKGTKEKNYSPSRRPASQETTNGKEPSRGSAASAGDAEWCGEEDLNPETRRLSDFKELCKSVASLLHIVLQPRAAAGNVTLNLDD